MASKGTQKGNRGQRKAIQCLKKWARKKFKSTSQSGMPGYNHDPHKGDILCDTEGHYFPFCVEVKNYREIDFSHLLRPGKQGVLVLEFWAQCSSDAKNVKKIPMLMMRYDRLPADFFFIVVTEEFCGRLSMFDKALCIKKKLTFWDRNGQNLIIIGSDQFFQLDYKETKLIAKKYLKTLYK